MARLRSACARLYTSPVLFATVMLATAVATFFRVRGTLNGHALAHWLINYEEGFIKRGMMGTLFQLRRVSELTGIPVESWFWFWVNFFLALLFVVVLAFCWQIYRLNRHWAYAVAPYFIAGPFLVSNASFIGYFDQIVALMVFAIALCLLRGQLLLPIALAAISVFIHENTVLLVLPLCGFWLLLGIVLGDEYDVRRQARVRALLMALLPLTTLCCFAFVYYYYELVLSQAQKAEYIARTIAPYEAFQRGPESIIRTLTTTYTGWWETEHEAVFYRLFDLYGFVAILLPLLAISVTLARWMWQGVRHQWFQAGVVYGLMIFPLSIFFMAFDVYRFWTFPVVLAVVFVYWTLRRTCARPLGARLPGMDDLRNALALAVLYQVLMPWPYLDWPFGVRLLVYLPLLVWYVCYLAGAGVCETDSALDAEAR